MAWVSSLNYRGIRGWRLPTALNRDGSAPVIGNNCVGSELGHLYLEVFATHPRSSTLRNGTIPCIYWTSTEASAEEAYALIFSVCARDALEGSIRREGFQACRYPALCCLASARRRCGRRATLEWLQRLFLEDRSTFDLENVLAVQA